MPLGVFQKGKPEGSLLEQEAMTVDDQAQSAAIGVSWWSRAELQRHRALCCWTKTPLACLTLDPAHSRCLQRSSLPNLEPSVKAYDVYDAFRYAGRKPIPNFRDLWDLASYGLKAFPKHFQDLATLTTTPRTKLSSNPLIFSNPSTVGKYDTVFKTNDATLLYVDSAKIPNGAFASVVRSTPDDVVTVDVAESSAVLDVILHALYDAAFSPDSPSLDLLDQSIDRMHIHGIQPPKCIYSGCAVYRALMTLAPDDPFRVYALAAFHNLHDLAVEVSSFTLALSLADVDDAKAVRMGAIYYKRLIALHFNRKHMLRDLIVFSPSSHPRTESCGNNEYITLSRAWNLRVSELLLSDIVLGGLTVDMLRDWFMTLESDLPCNLCIDSLKTRIDGLMSKWAVTRYIRVGTWLGLLHFVLGYR
ncbi:hypothetical protein BKA70DRAFT_1218991 [Coprinopsis sp. MPI-PUGE-AT-0042]|nr:hypothetical protein BKA70DRAFT_1218991 [Coprinopsis sp. MPI-PUGE-AT-0042]